MALKSEGRRFSFKNLVRMLYANFFAPVVIVFLFIQELTGVIITETFGVEQETWEVARLVVVLMLMALRYQTFREEI